MQSQKQQKIRFSPSSVFCILHIIDDLILDIVRGLTLCVYKYVALTFYSDKNTSDTKKVHFDRFELY